MCQEEELLVQKLTHSDNDTFKQLFSTYQPALFKFIYYKTNNYNLSQDIVQETFLKVWMKRASLKSNTSFFSYIVKISNNLLKDHFKYFSVRDKYKKSMPELNISVDDNPEEALNFKVLHEKIHTAANKHLSDTCRTIFFLSRIEGKSNTEISEMMNISNKKVENQLFYALKILKKKLDIS